MQIVVVLTSNEADDEAPCIEVESHGDHRSVRHTLEVRPYSFPLALRTLANEIEATERRWQDIPD